MANYSNMKSGITLTLTDSFRNLYYLAMFSLTKNENYHNVPEDRFEWHAEKHIFDNFLERVIYPVVGGINHPLAQQFADPSFEIKRDLTPDLCNRIFDDVRTKALHPACASVEDFDKSFDWLADMLEEAGNPLEGVYGPEEGEEGDAVFIDTEISTVEGKLNDYPNLASICNLEISPSLRKLYYLGVWSGMQEDRATPTSTPFGALAFAESMMFPQLCHACLFKILEYIPHPLTKKYNDPTKNELYDPTPKFVQYVYDEVKEFESLGIPAEDFEEEFDAFVGRCESNRDYKEAMSPATTATE